MGFFTIILFFIYTYGIGFSLAKLAKEADNFLERNLMRIGIGIASMIVLGLGFNILHVPLDWRIFLVASLMLPLFYLFKNIKNIKSFQLKITKYDLTILVMLLIFFATFYIYAKGAFTYPWLEDDDSWGHALGVKYVAVEKTVFAEKPLRYIDPYPPSYDMLLGILHQTNDSVYWTLKFFNALIISLSVIFFFFFAKELTDKNTALFSTFALASIPAFLSHFIWTIALSIPLYFISFYSAERIKHDKKWAIITAIAIGASLTISPTHSTYFGIFFAIYYIAKVVVEKKILLRYAIAGFLGVLISFFLWWLPAIIKHGFRGALKGIGSNLNQGIEFGLLNVAGTADKVYTLRDFVVTQKNNLINNPIGIGLVLSLLFVIAVISFLFKYKEDIKKHKFTILIVFLVLSSILLFILSYTYHKSVYNIHGMQQLSKWTFGSIPFSEFLSGQIFFISTLLIMVFLLVSLTVINYKNQEFKDKYAILVIAWLIFSFYAVNAGPYYYKLSPFRAWSIFVIPFAIFVSEGMWFLTAFLKNLMIPKFLVVSLIVIGVILTSAYQKYTVNTAIWPPGGFWTSNEEIQGYLWLRNNLQKNLNVFTFVNNGPVIGMDMYTCHWCSNVQQYMKNGFNESAEQNYNWLKREGYKYIIIDGQTARRFGANETSNKLQEFAVFGRFKPVFNNNGMIIFGVV